MKITIGIMSGLLLITGIVQAQQIDRAALVSRHNVQVKKIDPLSSLSLGNGKFAFTVDATGLQTFPEEYQQGIPLGTQSEWGWNSFKDTADYEIEESMKNYQQYGRPVSYVVQVKTPERKRLASEWFRQNAHRLQLGNVGFEILLKNGRAARPRDIRNISQQLVLWTGEIKSSFTVENEKVEVLTVSHQQDDLIAVKVKSKLIAQGRLQFRIRYPYPTGKWADMGTSRAMPEKHSSKIVSSANLNALILHQLDSAAYYTAFRWSRAARLIERKKHEFIIAPAKISSADQLSSASAWFELSVGFSPQRPPQENPLFNAVAANAAAAWKSFWLSGGAVDFAGSTDPRATELERRVVLSQYLTKIQCTGSAPPQETGLTYNSWFGKPHLEMTWWHMVHFPLWGRPELMEKSADWYFKVASGAKNIAARQGFKGLRWQKMTDNNGNEVPSSVGAMLIWQQPHIITFAELGYRAHPNAQTLEKYKELVFGTAAFMASFAHLDPKTGKYNLGPGLIPAQERFKAEDTFNPAYELAYWNWALKTAQTWRTRLGMPRVKEWDDVLDNLSPLPVQQGLYLAAESAKDSYTNPEYKTDHPSVLGTYGMLPETDMLDKKVMRQTFDLIWRDWSWAKTWGWDFPMTAMTAARLGMPEKAVDALFMPVKTNTYLANGHNYQDGRLTLYLPGNGGLLTAVAMMCAGWDGSPGDNPGFPKNAKWKVRWEGLQPML